MIAVHAIRDGVRARLGLGLDLLVDVLGCQALQHVEYGPRLVEVVVHLHCVSNVAGQGVSTYRY